MTIDNLMKVVPPPAEPFEPFAGPWDAIEARLRSPLPNDYKDYIRLYGTGSFFRFMAIYSPVAKNRYMNLFWGGQQVLDALDCVYDGEFPNERCPYPLWPHPEGLLPLGVTDNGDEIFWIRAGAPDDWRIVVDDRSGWPFHTFDCGLTDFLAGIAAGSLPVGSFLDELLPSEVVFEPHSDPPPEMDAFAQDEAER